VAHRVTDGPADQRAAPRADDGGLPCSPTTSASSCCSLFGPYTAPPLKRGDKTTCLFRDSDVVVTSWTDARITWPRCRVACGSGGGSGLLVDEELARAVRHESAAAVMFWWGASQTAVNNWRTALAVSR